MSGENGPGVEVGRARRVVLARSLPDAVGTPDHTVHLVGLPLSEDGDRGGVSGLCGTRLRPGQIETVVVHVVLRRARHRGCCYPRCGG